MERGVVAKRRLPLAPALITVFVHFGVAVFRQEAARPPWSVNYGHGLKSSRH